MFPIFLDWNRISNLLQSANQFKIEFIKTGAKNGYRMVKVKLFISFYNVFTVSIRTIL